MRRLVELTILPQRKESEVKIQFGAVGAACSGSGGAPAAGAGPSSFI